MFQLLSLEKLRLKILQVDHQAIAEIKSYNNPPQLVFDILNATFILLGEEDRPEVRMNIGLWHWKLCYDILTMNA